RELPKVRASKQFKTGIDIKGFFRQ
ncbi:inhibitor of Bruton tyrosine kinase, partial [Nephila pilipes]